MKILKLLNKYIFQLYFFLAINSFAEEQPVDIWNIDQEKVENNSSNSVSTVEGNLEEKNKSISNI